MTSSQGLPLTYRYVLPTWKSHGFQEKEKETAILWAWANFTLCQALYSLNSLSLPSDPAVVGAFIIPIFQLSKLRFNDNARKQEGSRIRTWTWAVWLQSPCFTESPHNPSPNACPVLIFFCYSIILIFTIVNLDILFCANSSCTAIK